ncbi:MAG TPA: hypothetical protein VFR63_08335 [Gaiellaceae bacterium]|nr:hypothetical protein [Gaiellaceae bacterium]
MTALPAPLEEHVSTFVPFGFRTLARSPSLRWERLEDPTSNVVSSNDDWLLGMAAEFGLPEGHPWHGRIKRRPPRSKPSLIDVKLSLGRPAQQACADH